MFGLHVIWMLVLFMVLAVPIVLIVLIVVAVSASHRAAYSTAPAPAQTGPPPPAPPARETPLEILDRRFASGEISAEEYQRARDLLKGGGQA